jgi:hypothetical protein
MTYVIAEPAVHSLYWLHAVTDNYDAIEGHGGLEAVAIVATRCKSLHVLDAGCVNQSAQWCARSGPGRVRGLRRRAQWSRANALLVGRDGRLK